MSFSSISFNFDVVNDNFVVIGTKVVYLMVHYKKLVSGGGY